MFGGFALVGRGVVMLVVEVVYTRLRERGGGEKAGRGGGREGEM